MKDFRQVRIGEALRMMAEELEMPLQKLVELSFLQAIAQREQKRREAGAR